MSARATASTPPESSIVRDALVLPPGLGTCDCDVERDPELRVVLGQADEWVDVHPRGWVIHRRDDPCNDPESDKSGKTCNDDHGIVTLTHDGVGLGQVHAARS